MLVRSVLVPIRGTRSYVHSTDLMAEGLAFMAEAAGLSEPRSIRLSYRRMLRHSALEATLARPEEPEGDHFATLSAHTGDHALTVRFRPSASPEIVRAECDQAQLLTCVDVGDRRADMTATPDSRPRLFPLLVAATKASSQRSFTSRTGAWLFGRCDLSALPKHWTTARVTTTAPEEARFFPWSVVVDGQALGTIMFFNEGSARQS